MAVKTAKMPYKLSLSGAGQVMASNISDARAKGMQVTPPQLDNKNAKRIKAGNLLSDLFDGND